MIENRVTLSKDMARRIDKIANDLGYKKRSSVIEILLALYERDIVKLEKEI